MIRRLAGRSTRIVRGNCCWKDEPCRRKRAFRAFASATNAANCSANQDHPNSSKETTINVLSSLSNKKCMDYAEGWAWQQVLMSHRLHTRRQLKSKQQNTESDGDPKNSNQQIIAQDNDCILLLEHAPVYTLGRGASEEHLTFLSTDSSSSDRGSDTEASVREKLSRKYKGKDAARLSMDRRALEDEIMRLPLRDAIDRVASNASPVLAPNGVPIFRVDRGGEVTFHGPNQLVVYPIIDLKRDPYKSDLHWFLRQVEEVVIQTLRHYDIESVRDDINTGQCSVVVSAATHTSTNKSEYAVMNTNVIFVPLTYSRLVSFFTFSLHGLL